jgi:hypothetical protein
VYNKVLQNNPQFSASTTRVQVCTLSSIREWKMVTSISGLWCNCCRVLQAANLRSPW